MATTGAVTVTTSLNVQAGVVVRFRASTYILVNGSLTTSGTVPLPVTFTADADTVGGAPAPGAWYGILGMGAVYHTVNPRLFPDQIAWIVNHAEDRALFFDVSFADIVAAIAPALKTVELYVAMTDRALGQYERKPTLTKAA